MLTRVSQLVLLVCVALLLDPGPGRAQNILAKVSGVVKKVDADVGTITLRTKGVPEDETFSLLKKEIAVTAAWGEKATLAAVAPGHAVQLHIGLGGDVEAIVIQSQVFQATLSAVDLAKCTVTLDDGRTLAVDAAVKISLAERPAYLREIKPGSSMHVTPSLDGKRIVALRLIAEPEGKLAAKLYPRVKVSRLAGVRWVGTLTAVHADKGEVALSGPKTKYMPKSMPVAPDAMIQQMHGQVAVQQLALDQIKSKTPATVLVSTADQRITRILVETPTVPATIKAVDAVRGTLTVELDGKPKSFKLPRHVKVMDRTRVRRLPELQAEQPVNLVLSLDEQRLLAIDIRQ